MSTITLTIKDETFGGKILNEISISIQSEKVKVRDIIEARVIAEVEAYNQKLDTMFYGLVQPAEAEVMLNGYKMKEKRRVDAEKQVYVAFEAYLKNGFFVLVDNIQVGDLDEEILIGKDSAVSFVKLTPLVGG